MLCYAIWKMRKTCRPSTEILCLPTINKIYCLHDLRVVNLWPFWVGKSLENICSIVGKKKKPFATSCIIWPGWPSLSLESLAQSQLRENLIITNSRLWGTRPPYLINSCVPCFCYSCKNYCFVIVVHHIFVSTLLIGIFLTLFLWLSENFSK
jgi:hypothetical protein